ncbi:MAG: glycoside hydrolase family 57 protein [Verrucomicrobiota bacterium]
MSTSPSSPEAVCIYFQAHQPNRLKPYTFFDVGRDPFYENDELNGQIVSKVSDKCYIPANRLFTEVLGEHEGRAKISFSISGVLLEQLEHHRPDAMQSFVQLLDTGNVELLAETYYHSLCFRHSGTEFVRQVRKQEEKLDAIFGVKPRVFRHTELIYFNELAEFVESMGYKGMLAEGVPWLLADRTPNGLYQSPGVKELKVLTRNFRLSDDIAFRFADKNWTEYPLSAKKFADWIECQEGDLVNLFIDYETIGEHQWEDTGIFDFWRDLPGELLERGIDLLTPSEAIDRFESLGAYDVHKPTSWADSEKDLSAWKGNPMQNEANRKILELEKKVLAKGNAELLHQWSKMQTSDHFYYMCTKGAEDGAVHSYFNPYPSPYEGYIYFMNALSDLQLRVEEMPDAPETPEVSPSQTE